MSGVAGLPGGADADPVTAAFSAAVRHEDSLFSRDEYAGRGTGVRAGRGTREGKLARQGGKGGRVELEDADEDACSFDTDLDAEVFVYEDEDLVAKTCHAGFGRSETTGAFEMQPCSGSAGVQLPTLGPPLTL